MSCAPRRPGLPSGVALLNKLSCTNDRPSTLSRSIVLIVAVNTNSNGKTARRYQQSASASHSMQRYCYPTAAKTLGVTLVSIGFLGICRKNREPTSGLKPLTPAHYE